MQKTKVGPGERIEYSTLKMQKLEKEERRGKVKRQMSPRTPYDL